ncbi:MAG: ketopantoate reductase family protein [Candidatus Heteroscillospira sp.]|jgi:2-dehydropantoate 2-reductase
MKQIKTVSLIGLGAIGTYLATRLQSVLGDDLRIIAGGERKERILRDGMIANGERYDFHVVEPDEETGFADLAIIIPKFMGLRQSLEDMRNQIGPETLMLAPLNGVDAEEIVGEYYPAENIITSLMMVSSVKKGNSCTFDPKSAFIQFGEKKNEGEYSPRVAAVKELFERAGINVRVPRDMMRAKWMKYMINVSENQSSAVLGICYKAWTGISPSADFVREKLAREVIAIAQAQGIDLTEEDLAKRRERVVVVLPQNKTSTLQDIEAGRHTEVDIFSGTIMRLGKKYGIPTPYNEMFYHMIKVLEEKNDGLFKV